MTYLYGMGATQEEIEARQEERAEEYLQIEKKRLEHELSEKSSFWTLAEKVATVGIPVITFLGIAGWFKLKGK